MIEKRDVCLMKAEITFEYRRRRSAKGAVVRIHGKRPHMHRHSLFNTQQDDWYTADPSSEASAAAEEIQHASFGER